MKTTTRLLLRVVLFGVACLLLAAAAAATSGPLATSATKLTLKPALGPPTTQTTRSVLVISERISSCISRGTSCSSSSPCPHSPAGPRSFFAAGAGASGGGAAASLTSSHSSPSAAGTLGTQGVRLGQAK